jgi:V/A-type H+-transporting ATPase subunit K
MERLRLFRNLAVLALGFVVAEIGPVYAASPEEFSIGYGLAVLGAGVVLGLAGLGVGIGMGTLGAAGAGAVAERPEVFTKVILFIVFLEAIAIYALTLGFMILMRL